MVTLYLDGVSKNFSIRFPESQLAELRTLSRLTGLSESDLVRQCVNHYLPNLREALTPRFPTPSPIRPEEQP